MSFSPTGSKKSPKMKPMMCDLKKAIVRHAEVLKPNEFENKSRVKPKTKHTTINVTLFIFVGKVKMKTRHI